MLVRALQFGEAALLSGVVAGELAQVGQVYFEVLLPSSQGLEELVPPGDRETARAGFDVDQAGQQIGRCLLYTSRCV